MAPPQTPVSDFEVYKNALDYMKERPHRSYFFGSIPISVSIPFKNKKVTLPFRKRPIIQKIVEQLYLMGLTNVVDNIYDALPNCKSQEQPHKELLDALYENLNSIHEKLKDNKEPLEKELSEEEKELSEEEKERREKAVQCLEKMIHQYADEIGKERRYNLEEVEKKLKKLDAERASKTYFKKRASLIDKNASRDDIKNIRITEEADLSPSLAAKTEKLIAIEKALTEAKNATQQYVKIHKDNAKLLETELPTPVKIFITVAALLVAVGQGLVVGYFLANTFPMWFALGVCATAGFIVNYSLFKGDFSNLLKEIYINGPSGFFKDKNGNFLSPGEITLISLAGVSCVAAATALGFITFNSVHSTIIAVLALAGTTSPLGAAIVGGIIALCTTMCLAALLFMGINRFIKEGKYLTILKSLKKDFYDVWKCTHKKGWDSLLAHEKLKHVSKQAVIAFGNLLLLLLKVSPAIIVFFAMRGLFHAEAVKTMTTLFHWSAPLAHTVATAIIDGAATIANGFFYSKGMIMMVEVIQKCIKKCISSVASFIKDPTKYYNDFSNLRKNRVRLIATIIKLILVPLLLICIGLNSFGQALGANDPTALGYVQGTIIPASASVVIPINETLSGASSGGLNLAPSFNAIELPPDFNKNSLFFTKNKAGVSSSENKTEQDLDSAYGTKKEPDESNESNESSSRLLPDQRRKSVTF